MSTPALAQSRELAHRFRELNLAGRLLLPNAWDGASARLFEHAGFEAVATTSAGVAYSRGLPDAERIDRDTMMREVECIVRAVRCPVTADIEAGYGPAAQDVAQTVEAALAAGAVGINLEDALHGPDEGSLIGIEDQAARIGAARAVGERRDIALVINARTDTFLAAIGNTLDERMAQTIERGRAYLAAGADLVFVPGLTETALIGRLAQAFEGRLSLMAAPGAPPAKELFAAGAKRVSLGPFPMLAALGTLRDVAKELRESGTWQTLGNLYPLRDLEALLDR